MIDRLITRVLWGWQRWRIKRKLYREHPELYHFDAAERDAQRSHGRVNSIRQARRDYMTAALRRAR